MTWKSKESQALDAKKKKKIQIVVGELVYSTELYSWHGKMYLCLYLNIYQSLKDV